MASRCALVGSMAAALMVVCSVVPGAHAALKVIRAGEQYVDDAPLNVDPKDRKFTEEDVWKFHEEHFLPMADAHAKMASIIPEPVFDESLPPFEQCQQQCMHHAADSYKHCYMLEDHLQKHLEEADEHHAPKVSEALETCGKSGLQAVKESCRQVCAKSVGHGEL
eukprot:TRINITY_DN2599_c0_g1_i1.p1 TRINITY_DN2599_c0_g1~~TRINITY_DN2599_c0_g1_i1.p1  ORF type:complete len:165 (-),score=44.94 TRINITY_DN2599_c0_g1_i1:73-567(-)